MQQLDAKGDELGGEVARRQQGAEVAEGMRAAAQVRVRVRVMVRGRVRVRRQQGDEVAEGIRAGVKVIDW